MKRVKVHIEEHFISSFWVSCEDTDNIDEIINQKYKDGELRPYKYDTPTNVLYAIEEENGLESDFVDMDIDSYL